MMKSMTGYGKAQGEIRGRKIQIEIKSINSKNLDLGCKLPFDLRELESEFRARIGNVLQRGKVECYLNYLQSDEAADAALLRHLNLAQVKSYAEELRQLGLGETESLLKAVELPWAVSEVMQEALREEDKRTVLSVLDAALEALDESRKQEGGVLEKDFVLRVETIEKLAYAVEPFEKDRVPALRARLEKQLSEWETAEKKIDANRLEQEMIYYLEKLDITEEKVRLHKHCKYFFDTMQEEASGRKLAFIAQEMGREINTLGSKANEANMQKLVVEMKDELEKIKEQLFNIL